MLNDKTKKTIPLFVRIAALVLILSAFLYLTLTVSFWPEDYFRVERKNAVMPVWVRGNIESEVFVIFNHGGPGSSGTLESIFEVNPANGRFDHESPFKILESMYAMVYWDQRHSGLSKGSPDPNDSVPEDFGEDLATVIDELERRYNPKKIFIIGQSWGHCVATSYLTQVDEWSVNQNKINGYIDYKGNHEQEMPYEIARELILKLSIDESPDNLDMEKWRDARAFYREHTSLTTLSDFWLHNMYVEDVMGDSIDTVNRISSSVKASFFSPFNGFTYYSNNKRTNNADDFMARIAFDSSMRDTIHRLHIPTLLIYGKNDLIAPVGVGEFIYSEISTAEPDKSLLVLENSRHGAEKEDVEIMQKAIIEFIEKYKR